MVQVLARILTLAVLTGHVVAIPSNPTMTSPRRGLGRHATWTKPRPAFWDEVSGNASSLMLEKRQTETTECYVGGDQVHVQDANAADGDRPLALTILWEAVYGQICLGNLGCDGTQVCTMATEWTELCVSVEGSFRSEDKAMFLDSAREIFDRTVTYGWNGPTDGIPIWAGANEFATDKVQLRARDGNGEVFVKFIVQEVGGMCPAHLDQIAAIGSLSAGAAAPFFGLITLICGEERRTIGSA